MSATIQARQIENFRKAHPMETEQLSDEEVARKIESARASARVRETLNLHPEKWSKACGISSRASAFSF
jgi:hypothetical protein